MILLRGLVKLVVVMAVAGTAGLGLALGLSKLSDPTPSQAPAGGAAATLGSSTSSVPAPTAAKPTPKPAPQDQLSRVGVSALSAVLHPAATPSGQRRQRARLTVVVRAHNGSRQPVSVPSPALLVGGVRVETGPRAQAPGAPLGPLPAGKAAEATLQFEVAGAVTTQLGTQHRAQLLLAGRTLTVAVTVGAPVAVASGTHAP